MFDVEKFIQYVELETAIWDMGTPVYKDRHRKEKSWHKVGSLMFSMWSGLNEAEKYNQVKLMKEKWRHLRDGYSKYITVLGKSREHGGVKKKKYVYADDLQFLLPTIQKRRRTAARNVKEEEDEGDEQEEDDVDPASQQEDQATMEAEEDTYFADESINFQGSPPSSSLLQKRSPCYSLSVPTTNFQPPQPSPQQVEAQRTEDDEACKAFLLSLLPDYRKLNDEQKLDFRFHCLQFFRDIRRGVK